MARFTDCLESTNGYTEAMIHTLAKVGVVRCGCLIRYMQTHAVSKRIFINFRFDAAFVMFFASNVIQIRKQLLP